MHRLSVGLGVGLGVEAWKYVGTYVPLDYIGKCLVGSLEIVAASKLHNYSID